MTPTRRDILKTLRTHVSPARVDHVLRVESLAIRLAERWGVSTRQASTAALLHDIARDESAEFLADVAGRSSDFGLEGLRTTVAPVVLHAPVSALMARDEAHVEDPEILEAIALHTTGGASMGTLARILFLADYCEEGRSFEGVDAVRSLLMSDLESALLTALAQTIVYLISLRRPVEEQTVRAYNSFAALLMARQAS